MNKEIGENSPRRSTTSYTTEPGEDPKATKEGWAALLNSAQAKLTAKLSVL